MSWHDRARTLEPDADAALREELRGLLGFQPRNYFESEPSPELNLLADDLRREAKRRNHTARKQHSWMLLAAAAPFALALLGVGAWGVSQKHKADSYAAAVQQKDAEINRLALATRPMAVAGAPSQAMVLGNTHLASRTVTPGTKGKPKELVEQLERSPEPVANDTHVVKGH